MPFRGAKRRGNLAVPGWITGKPRRKRNCLPEIATSACGLLAMTNLGAVAILTVARSSLQHCAGPGCPLPYSGRCSSAVPSRDCTPRALPRASRSGRHVGLRPPRNDKSLTNLWLSPFYRRSAVVASAVPGPAVRSPTMTSLLYGKGRDPFLGPRPYKMENR